jgi:xylulokinase
VAPGTAVGIVSSSAAEETSLPDETTMLAGMTDGCASQVSTGAVAPGQWNSTLGTTLVIKGVNRELVRDPLGRVYCHRHHDGHWLPGGASNTGGEAISRRFDAAHLDVLNAQALGRAPTNLIIYPLVRLGERFPFRYPDAEGFVLGEPGDEATYYTAHLEGVGYVERLAYEMLAGLGAEVGDEVRAAGGATGSRAWLQLRADILGKSILVPEVSGGAMGAAIVAAGGTIYEGIVPAAKAMVSIVDELAPRHEMRSPYDERYERFCEACRERGYLK